MTLLIAGCGDLGEAVARRALGCGERVHALRRSPEKSVAALAPLPVLPLRGDLTRDDTIPEVPRDVDTVVYAAAPGGGGEEAYRALYLDGLRRLLAACHARRDCPRLARLVFVSSTSVYGASTGDLDEDSEPGPQSETGRVLLAAERLALACGAATVLRSSGIYGPGRWHLGFVDQLRRGEPLLDEPARVMNRIHRDDLAAAVDFVLGSPRTVGSLLIASDHQPSTFGAFAEWVATRLDLPKPTFRAAAPDAPPARAHARAAMRRRLSSGRLRGLGFEFRFPTFREGYREELDRLRGRPVDAAEVGT